MPMSSRYGVQTVCLVCVLLFVFALMVSWLVDHDAACQSSGTGFRRLGRLRYLWYRSRCAWISDARGARHHEALASAMSVARFVETEARPHGVVTVLDARSLKPDALFEAVRNAPMNAVLIRHAFHIAEDVEAVARSLPATTRSYSANDGQFPAPPTCAPSGPRLVRRAGVLRLPDLLLPSSKLTDFNIFHAVPAVSERVLERRHVSCHGRFMRGSVEAQLMARITGGYGRPSAGIYDVKGSVGGHSALDRRLVAALLRGNRRIFSAGRVAASIQFHSHASTWFALTHGRKAWWLGPSSLALELSAYGNVASACTYLDHLHHTPDPRVELLVQEAGDILLFGEGVSHATCNLNASLGIGIQMGYSKARHLSINGTLYCTAKDARRGTHQSDAEQKLRDHVGINSSTTSRSRTDSGRGSSASQNQRRSTSVGCVRLSGQLGALPT